MTYLLVVVAALMFGRYNVFIKLSADHIQAVLGAVVLQFVAAFLGLGWLLYLQVVQPVGRCSSARAGSAWPPSPKSPSGWSRL